MIGEFAALLTALFWAIAARLFFLLGQYFTPIALNLWKEVFAVAFLGVALALFVPYYPLDTYSMLYLLASGAIGIGLGDTFFFKALNKIGDSQTILVAETAAPVLTAILAMIWINEWLTWQQWVGVAFVILAVDMVVKTHKKTNQQLFSITGYSFAALAALCQAVGAVFSRDILTSTGVDPLNASLWRLIGGFLVLVVLAIVTRTKLRPVRKDITLRNLNIFIAAVVLGTVSTLYLQMLAFSHTKAAVVQTLFSTSVIISLIIASVLGEKVKFATYVWSSLALAGVLVLTLA